MMRMADSFEAVEPVIAPSGNVARIVSSSNSSFLLGMRILPRHRREAIHAVYAFCRVVDDIVDEPGDRPAKLAALDHWEDEVRRIDGPAAPRTELGLALRDATRSHNLPVDEFHRLLLGMRRDLDPMLGPNLEDLRLYARSVAGSVGILSMHIFGEWRGDTSRRFALALAEALQLTNILRDVHEDARIGRVYLPGEFLAAAGIDPCPAGIASAPRLAEVRRSVGQIARSAFSRAAGEIRHHDRRRLLPALLMMGPYERLLGQMEQDWHRPPPRRSKVMKVFDGLRCAALQGLYA
jgi:presqualene diphosphate synthase